MVLETHPLTEADIQDWRRILGEAFGNGPDDVFFSPRPYSEASKEKLKQASYKQLATPGFHGFKAVDTDLSKTIGIATWFVYPRERSMDEVNTAMDTPRIPEYNQAGVDAFFKLIHESRMETMGTKPHVLLSILVVDPKHQRKGAGKELMRWGCAKADELGLDAYLEASDRGLGLYEKFGFEAVSHHSLDRTPYGGEGLATHTCMIRKPTDIDR